MFCCSRLRQLIILRTHESLDSQVEHRKNYRLFCMARSCLCIKFLLEVSAFFVILQQMCHLVSLARGRNPFEVSVTCKVIGKRFRKGRIWIGPWYELKTKSCAPFVYRCVLDRLCDVQSNMDWPFNFKKNVKGCAAIIMSLSVMEGLWWKASVILAME